MGLELKLNRLRKAGDVAVFSEPTETAFHLSFVVRVVHEVPGSEPHDGEWLVGFSPVCTHLGCLLVRSGSKDDDVVYERKTQQDGKDVETLTCGPCPCHGTTFDLREAGLVALGPATQNLAQLELEVDLTNEVVTADGWLGGRDPRAENWPYTRHK